MPSLLWRSKPYLLTSDAHYTLFEQATDRAWEAYKESTKGNAPNAENKKVFLKNAKGLADTLISLKLQALALGDGSFSQEIAANIILMGQEVKVALDGEDSRHAATQALNGRIAIRINNELNRLLLERERHDQLHAAINKIEHESRHGQGARRIRDYTNFQQEALDLMVGGLPTPQ